MTYINRQIEIHVNDVLQQQNFEREKMFFLENCRPPIRLL